MERESTISANAPLDTKSLKKRQQHYRKIAKILLELYGLPEWRQHLPPVDELVSTILSQNTSDINRDKAFYALKGHYPDWESVRDAPVEEVIQLIRPAGLSQTKGPRIQATLRYLTESQGKISLDLLTDMPIEEAKNWLTSIHGIGPKTAAIILLFAFNHPAFPVDTHVHRVTGRLGLIDEKTSADAAHVILESIIPPSEYYTAHLNIIQHGREICHARRPRCEICPLTELCRFYQQVVKEKA